MELFAEKSRILRRAQHLDKAGVSYWWPSEAKPQAGVWAPITLDGRPFYAAIDEVHGPNADAAISAFGGRTPRGILDELRRAFDASNRDQP